MGEILVDGIGQTLATKIKFIAENWLIGGLLF